MNTLDVTIAGTIRPDGSLQLDQPTNLPPGPVQVTLRSVSTRLQSPIHDAVEERFRRLEAKWMAESGHLSSYPAIISHPAFREIVGMGEAVVPFMLRDLTAGPRLWVWALPEITGVDPVPAGDGGRIAKMSEAWVRWGREHGYP